TGAGALGNRTIGTASVGGMVIGTIIGVIVIPDLVILFSKRKKVKITKASTVIAIFSLLFSACSVPKKMNEQELKAELQTDATQILTDSISLADIKWNSFFKDQHLVDLINIGLENNQDLRQAIHRIEIAQANFRQRKSALLPTLDAAVEGGIRKYGHYTESGIGNYDSNFSENLTADEKLPEPFIPDYFVGVRSSWEIDIWGKLRQRREAAYLGYLVENEAKRLVETELITSISSAYFELIAWDRKVKVYDRNIVLHERALEIIEAQKEAGRSDELAVQQFKSILAESRANRALALQEIVKNEHQINQLLGRVYQPIKRSEDAVLENSLFAEMMLGSFDQLISNRLDIRQAAFDLKREYRELDAARLSFLPSVAISPYLGLQSFSFDELFNLDKSVAYGLFGGVTMPILRQRELKSRYEVMKAQYGIAFLEYEKKVLNAVNEVSLAVETQKLLANREQLLDDQVIALVASTEAAEELFIAGRVSYLDIISAQKGVVQAQITKVDIQREDLLNQIVLYKALGGGWD